EEALADLDRSDRLHDASTIPFDGERLFKSHAVRTQALIGLGEAELRMGHRESAQRYFHDAREILEKKIRPQSPDQDSERVRLTQRVDRGEARLSGIKSEPPPLISSTGASGTD